MTGPVLTALIWFVVYLVAVQLLLTACQGLLISLFLIFVRKEVRRMSTNLTALQAAADAVAADVQAVRDLVVQLRGIADDLRAQLEAGQLDAAAIAAITQKLNDADVAFDSITAAASPDAAGGAGAGNPPATSPGAAGQSVVEIARANEANKGNQQSATDVQSGIQSDNPPGAVASERT